MKYSPLAVFSLLMGASLPMALAAPQSSPGPRFVSEWVGVKPSCDNPDVSRLAGQPQVGLVAFRTRCPGETRDRVISARVSAKTRAFSTDSPISKGSPPNRQNLQQIEVDIRAPAQWPLDEESLERVSARRNLPAGAVLVARDFEAKLLWRGGDRVAVKSFAGMVSVDTQGLATSIGREGERASAKLESGKIVEGSARVGVEGAWIEIRQP